MTAHEDTVEQVLKEGILAVANLMFPERAELVEQHLDEAHRWGLRDGRMCCTTHDLVLLPSPFDLTEQEMDAKRPQAIAAIQRLDQDIRIVTAMGGEAYERGATERTPDT